jgi:hypothetical protein
MLLTRLIGECGLGLALAPSPARRAGRHTAP